MERVTVPQKSGHKTRQRVHVEHFSLRKRSAPKFPCSENDIFVNNKSNLQAQIQKCEKLFQEGFNEIVIHGLGAAIGTAVNIALMLQDKLSHTVDIAVNTSTVDLLDDFFPLTDDEKPFSELRSNSAIHIKIKRKINF